MRGADFAAPWVIRAGSLFVIAVAVATLAGFTPDAAAPGSGTGTGGAVDSVFGRTGAVVASSGDYSSHYQSLDANELSPIAGLTSAADRLPYYTGSGSAALATFTSFARSLVDDTTAAAARATLGLDDPLVSQQVLQVSETWTNATTTYSTVTGLTFTPAANGVYVYEYYLSASSTVSTNGLAVQVSQGNAVSGSADMRVRGSGATTAVVYNGPIATAATVGTSSPATPGDRFSASGYGFFTAAGSPTAFSVQAANEDASNTVTIVLGEGVLRYRRLQ